MSDDSSGMGGSLMAYSTGDSAVPMDLSDCSSGMVGSHVNSDGV